MSNPPGATPPAAASPSSGRAMGATGRPPPTAAEKLARRLAALPDGRYQVIVTVSATGLVDWSILLFGKVERP